MYAIETIVSKRTNLLNSSLRSFIQNGPLQPSLPAYTPTRAEPNRCYLLSQVKVGLCGEDKAAFPIKVEDARVGLEREFCQIVPGSKDREGRQVKFVVAEPYLISAICYFIAHSCFSTSICFFFLSTPFFFTPSSIRPLGYATWRVLFCESS